MDRALDGTAFFAYGSLIYPEVLHAVTGLQLLPQPASLHGYARYLVRHESYPGIVPCSGAATDGALYTGVHEKALERLDRFEGEYYERVTVSVTCNGSSRGACTYVFRPAFRHLLTDLPWNPDTFRTRHLGGFLRDYEGFLWMDDDGR